jgi:hypothetical protein
MPDPVITVTGDVSETPEQLNAKIDAELGLEPQAPPAPAADETTPETPPADPETGEPVSPEDPTPTSPPAEEPKEEPAAKDTPPATPADTDLFIEVEDANGVTHKISAIEDLPEDFEPKHNRQILEIVAKIGKLESQRETQATTAAETARQEAETKAQAERFKSWDNEVEALAKDKRIDPKDTERVDAVFAHMNKINAARREAGNPNLVNSFEDALEKLEAVEAKQVAESAKKTETDNAKKKAGLIGRTSSAAGDNYVYRAGSARSIDDIPVHI